MDHQVSHLEILDGFLINVLGTGKTFVAGALAAELNKLGLGKVSFYHRKGADILDKWVGESERKLREVFEKVSGILVSN